MIKNLFFVERDDEGIYFDKQGKSRSIDLVKGMSELRNEITPIEARALADAIYNDLGLGWLPYPENEPEDTGIYSAYFITTSKGVVDTDYYDDYDGRWRRYDDVIAFKRYPKKYQPA